MSRRFSSPIPLVRTGVMSADGISVVSVPGDLGPQLRLANEALARTRLVLHLADDQVEHRDAARVADPAGVVRIRLALRTGRLAARVGVNFPGAPRLGGLHEWLD